ncbi:ribonuclease H-like domain-containing protein [Tanacetum coccineum]
MAFVSTPGSTNEVDTANIQVRTGSTPVSTTSHKDSTANLSDATVYAFLADQPNRSQLVHEDLEQIHEDDLEEMDLKWQLALLSMRARRNNGAPLIVDWESDGEDDVKSPPEIERKTLNPSVDKVKVDKSKQNDKTTRRLVKYAEMYRKQRPRVNIAKGKVNTARPNSVVLNAIRANKGKAVKASACWVWRSIKLDSASIVLKKHTYIDARGRSKSVMAWEFDGGYVAFMGGAKGGKITGKGTIRTGKLDFEDLADENHVLLKVPRKKNMYSVDMKNIVHKKDLTCLVAKATNEESMLWILKNFINEIENLVDKKEKIIRCDNGTEFKNKVMDDFFREKGIKREYSVARTPQQNRVAERRNRTLIEAARTMLADSILPTTFWVEAINTACYVQNRVLVVKPYFKTPYELFRDSDDNNKDNDGPCQKSEGANQERPNAQKSTNNINTAVSSNNTTSSNINTAGPTVNTVRQIINNLACPNTSFKNSFRSESNEFSLVEKENDHAPFWM